MARRGLDKYLQKASGRPPTTPTASAPADAAETPPPPRRKKLSTQTMFLLAAGMLLAAAFVFFLIFREKQEAKEEFIQEKKEKIGEVGRQSNFDIPRTPGLNLPVAHLAFDVPGADARVVEVPIEWADDFEAARARLAERFQTASAGLSFVSGTDLYNEPVTLKVDRELTYRFMALTIIEGRKAGFVNYYIACLKTATETDVGYLKVILPPSGEKDLLFRMYHDGTEYTYVIGEEKIVKRKTLEGVTDLLKRFHARSPNMLLTVAPTIQIPVQHFVEGLQSATAAGYQRITLANPIGID